MSLIKAQPVQRAVKIAVITSRFNQLITEKLFSGAMERLGELGCKNENVLAVEVPGAVEIPLIAQQLAAKQEYDAIIALGAVIRGETTHYDYVCDQASQGCQRVMLDYHTPVVFGVLTTENKEQALDRVGGAHGHKGRDAVDAAFEMISLLGQL